MQLTANTKPLNLEAQRNWPAARFEKCFDYLQTVKKWRFDGDWAELKPKSCLIRLSENFASALYTSNNDSNF